MTKLKRCQALRAAYLIDQGQTEEAMELLEHFRDREFSDEKHEKDIEMLVHSLYGILSKETEKGKKSIDRAKQLARDIDLKYERK